MTKPNMDSLKIALKNACDPDDGRELTAHPWAVAIDGKPYTFACNGFLGLLVNGASDWPSFDAGDSSLGGAMSDKSAIEWTDSTWSPVTGCTKVSPGCAHCYIERTPPFRMAGRKFAYQSKELGVTTGVQLHPDRLEQPLHWKKPRRIFVNSLSDLFHGDVPDEFIPKVFAVIAATPWHTYQILTKRPERMLEVVADHVFYGMVDQEARHSYGCGTFGDMPWPLPNVWLGVSAENQYWADRRIPILAAIPAAVRFVSAEPLLGPMDLREWLQRCVCGCPPSVHGPYETRCEYCAEDFGEDGCNDFMSCSPEANEPDIHWIIAGGESGPKARPAHPGWFRQVRDQCQAAGVPFFLKQWGEWAPVTHYNIDTVPRGETWWPQGKEHIWGQGMVRVGKARAGALLDGREWREFPEMGHA